jgi:hypothetical protein
MSKTSVDGFCFLNIDVPLPTANPVLALLTACLNTLNRCMDMLSLFSSRSLSWAYGFITVLVRAVGSAGRQREHLSASRSSTSREPSHVCNQLRCRRLLSKCTDVSRNQPMKLLTSLITPRLKSLPRTDYRLLRSAVRLSWSQIARRMILLARIFQSSTSPQTQTPSSLELSGPIRI